MFPPKRQAVVIIEIILLALTLISWVYTILAGYTIAKRQLAKNIEACGLTAEYGEGKGQEPW